MNRPRLAALVITGVAMMSACAGQSSDRSATAQAAAAPVVALTSVEQFAAAFDADTGTARLILPISPT